MVSPIFSQHFNELWDSFTVAAIVVAIITFSMMAWLIVSFRAKKGYDMKKDSPFIPGTFPEDRENLRLEVTWFVIPLAIVVWLTMISLGPLSNLWPANPEKDAMENFGEDVSLQYVTVVGRQWNWYFTPSQLVEVVGDGSDVNGSDAIITGEDLNTISSHPDTKLDGITVECNRPVIFYIYSSDVQHSFFLPEFGIKEDAVPGLQTRLYMIPPTNLTEEQMESKSLPPVWGSEKVQFQDGNYTAQLKCAEYCGKDHARMLANITITGYDSETGGCTL